MGWLSDVLHVRRWFPSRAPRWHEIYFEGPPPPETLCWVARTSPDSGVPVEVALYRDDGRHAGWLGVSWWESPRGTITHWMPAVLPLPPAYHRRTGLLVEVHP